MKKCKDCGFPKDESDFYGVQNECKECTKARVKLNGERVGRGYDFTEIGVVRVIYKTQKRNNKSRGHGDMAYSKPELSDWLYLNGFKELYDAWVKSGNVKDLKPSVDRIDDLKGYSFCNIRLTTWVENRRHQHSDIVNAIGTGGLRCKALLKLDCDMGIVCEYVSYSSAQRDMGYSLEYAIKNKIKCRNGFYWKYK